MPYGSKMVAKHTVERRRHKRHRVSCLAKMLRESKDKSEAVKTRSIDLSDGGAMLAIPIKVVPRISEKIRVVLSVPRETPNTRMVEDFSCEARVIRHQPLRDNEVVGVAVQFQPTVRLGLEV
jgi:c-di-GMP-binding flagellar brake protein YcgR